MKERWILFYDGACPLCNKAKSKISKILDDKIKLATIDLNSEVALLQGYTNKDLVLVTPSNVFYNFDVWKILISNTKYKWITNPIFRPVFYLFYLFVSKNKKIISKII